MKTIFFLFLLCITTISTSAQEPSIKALLITGGDWHDYETQKELLINDINNQVEEEISGQLCTKEMAILFIMYPF